MEGTGVVLSQCTSVVMYVLEDISEERKKDSNDEDACEGECDLPWVP